MAAVCAGSLALGAAGLPAAGGLTAGVAVGLLTARPHFDEASAPAAAAGGGSAAGNDAASGGELAAGGASGWFGSGDSAGSGGSAGARQELVVDIQVPRQQHLQQCRCCTAGPGLTLHNFGRAHSVGTSSLANRQGACAVPSNRAKQRLKPRTLRPWSTQSVTRTPLQGPAMKLGFGSFEPQTLTPAGPGGRSGRYGLQGGRHARRRHRRTARRQVVR